MIVRMSFYGLKSSGAAVCTHLDKTLNDIGFLYTKVDPGVWYRPVDRPNGFEYYEYILCYVDNTRFISHDTGIALRHIQAILKL